MSKISVIASIVVFVGAVGAGQFAWAVNRASDNQLLGALKNINDGEIAEGNSAVATSTNQDVKDFGQEMVQDHTTANQEINQFASSQSISPTEGSLALKFRAAQAKDRTETMILRGSSFDKKYLQEQIADHQKVLSMLNAQSGSRSPAMTQLINNTKQMVAQHLQEAKNILRRMQA